MKSFEFFLAEKKKDRTEKTYILNSSVHLHECLVIHSYSQKKIKEKIFEVNCPLYFGENAGKLGF